jgi:hypothetical protein
VEKESKFVVPLPAEIPEKATATQKRIWERRVDDFVKRENKLAENYQTLDSLVWGQCTEYMRAKLKAVTSYEAMKGSLNLIALLKTIKGLIYQHEGHKYNPWPGSYLRSAS